MADQTRIDCGRKPNPGKHKLKLLFITSCLIRDYQSVFRPLVCGNPYFDQFYDGVLFGDALFVRTVAFERLWLGKS